MAFLTGGEAGSGPHVSKLRGWDESPALGVVTVIGRLMPIGIAAPLNRLAIGLFALVEFEPGTEVLAILAGEELDGPGLPFHGRSEVTCFGGGGRQSVE